MKSALECFQLAAACERLAEEAVVNDNRTALLSTASQWRKLGSQAKAKETGKIPDEYRKPPKA
jgi:hypothetical protein